MPSRRFASGSEAAIARRLIRCFTEGGKLLICGNGGSAADAQHIAAEFVGRYRRERRPLPAVALVDPVTITAIGNDYGFDMVFARQVLGLGVRNDVLLALSTSGRSMNVLRAVDAAQMLGMTVIGMSGSAEMVEKCGMGLVFQRSGAAAVQEATMRAMHRICDRVDAWCAS